MRSWETNENLPCFSHKHSVIKTDLISFSFVKIRYQQKSTLPKYCYMALSSSVHTPPASFKWWGVMHDLSDYFLSTGGTAPLPGEVRLRLFLGLPHWIHRQIQHLRSRLGETLLQRLVIASFINGSRTPLPPPKPLTNTIREFLWFSNSKWCAFYCSWKSEIRRLNLTS